jgi:S-layer protein (TIGR01564 family)
LGTQKSVREPVKWNQDYVASDDDRDVDKLKNSKNLVLVGGPAANSLVSELVQANKTAPASEYSRDQGLLHIVNDAFSEGHDALIVAGHSGEDTRMAGRYLTNYRQNMETLQGREKLRINTTENKMNTS